MVMHVWQINWFWKFKREIYWKTYKVANDDCIVIQNANDISTNIN